MGGKSIISNSYLEDIGDAIRYKKGTEETFYPSQMGDAIRSIEGIVPVGSIEIDANGVYNVTEKAEAVVSVQPDLRPLSVSENGTYEPDDFDGYSDVTVDVEPALESLTVTENGLYLPTAGVDGYDRVTVDVPPTVPDLVPLDVTANGQYLPTGHDGFSEVNVNVPATVPVTESLSVTENGTYVPSAGIDGFNEVVVNVPTGGGGGLTLIDTIEVNGVNGVRTDINMSWFDDYDYVMMIPDLTFSASDWPYVAQDATTGGGYATRMPSIGIQQSLFLGMTGSKLWGAWFRDSQSRTNPFDPASYLYWHLYSASTTMTGTIKIYGIKVS